MKRTRLLAALFVVIAPVAALAQDLEARTVPADRLPPGISNDVRAASEQDPAQLIGLWRGTSTCTDRVAAPACQDEQVVYDFSAAATAGTVHWVADKIVNGKREPMGELDLEYDKTEACWKVEFTSPRMKLVWRLTVDGKHLTGTARLLPGNETVRKVDLRKP